MTPTTASIYAIFWLLVAAALGALIVYNYFKSHFESLRKVIENEMTTLKQSLQEAEEKLDYKDKLMINLQSDNQRLRKSEDSYKRDRDSQTKIETDKLRSEYEARMKELSSKTEDSHDRLLQTQNELQQYKNNMEKSQSDLLLAWEKLKITEQQHLQNPQGNEINILKNRNEAQANLIVKLQAEIANLNNRALEEETRFLRFKEAWDNMRNHLSQEFTSPYMKEFIPEDKNLSSVDEHKE